MNNIIIYGGQGNITLKDLTILEKSENGKELLSRLKKVDLESYDLFYNVLDNMVPLTEIYASMLCTFLYNEWKTDYNKITLNTFFSSHSAGIFNVLLASGSADFSSLILFIKKRANLIKKINRSESLWLLLGKDVLFILKRFSNEFMDIVDCAIVTDENSLVLAMDSNTKNFFELWLKSNKITAKILDMKVNAPYHTNFLKSSIPEYTELVYQLNICQNTDYGYIFESDCLEKEVINQWACTFKWNDIKKRIVAIDANIVDISPNSFISKQLKKIKNR